MRRLRVGHVITRLCKGGAQENTFSTVRLANPERFESELIAGYAHGAEGSIEAKIADAGIEILRVPDLVRNPAPLKDWKALRALEALFRERHYDIVHTHTSKAGYVGRLAAARAGVQIVVHTPHGNIFDGYFNPLTTGLFVWMERHAANKTDCIITLTHGGVEAHLARGIGVPEQYETIFSGVDFAPYALALEQREHTRATLGVGSEEILVGGVGRLEPIKGFIHLIEAAKMIATKDAKVRFVLAGDGSLSEELRAAAQPLGDRFQFLGMRDDVPALMAAMDIFVLPSINEGMGRVILEAAAGEAAIVASAVGGVPDIIRHGENGILVSPRSNGAIADAVSALVRDAEQRAQLARAARTTVVPHYGLERMVKRIESLYEQLIKEKGLDRC